MRPQLLVAAVAASALLAACGSSDGKSSSSTSSRSAPRSSGSASATVKTASNSRLGKTILVNGQGMTLYRLSGETSAKFICASSCVAIWHPATVASGTKPSGPVASLSVVKRPEGAEQIAYKGMPLYTFAEDKAPGEANGQGIKDVGTWSVVAVSGSTASAGGGSAMPAESGESEKTGGPVGY